MPLDSPSRQLFVLGGSGQSLGALATFSAHGRCSFARHGCLWHPLQATGFSGLALFPSFPGMYPRPSERVNPACTLNIPKPARGVCGIQCSRPSEGQRPYQGQPLLHRSRYGSCQICWAASGCVRRSVYSTWPLRSGLPSIMHGMTMKVKLLIWSNHPDPSLQGGVLKS